MRKLFSLVVIEVILVNLAVRGESQNPAGSDSLISVAASTTGRFAHGCSWLLSVNSAGSAHLTIDTYPKQQSREFQVSKKQMERLAQVLDKERFFSLQSEYGEEVVDGSTDTITIVRGDLARTVTIHYLMNWVYSDRSKLKEPARAVRVFQVIRGWFDDKDAVDLRKYDEIILKAADKG